ncbi:MAG: hypothetical protein ABMA64_06975 [Myxococcota bacterium]
MKPDGLRTTNRPPGRLAARWLSMLEGLEERIKGRVLRGRTLARAGRVHELELAPGAALAGVQDADVQRPTVRVRTFDDEDWAKVMAALRSRLSLLAKLLEGEVADDLLGLLDAQGVPLVPRADEIDGDCDCGDWAVPCAHGAALHHVLGEALDGEPFLLFTLRGRTRDQLFGDLRRAWGDPASPRAPREPKRPVDVDATDPFSSPAPPPLIAFRFGTSGPPGMLELGPLAGDDDLQRALMPLYDAGAEASLALALGAHEADPTPRRRRARSTVPRASIVPAATPLARAAPVNADLTERIVDALACHDRGATLAELAAELALDPEPVARELDEIGALGLVYRTGEGPTTRWFVG